MTKLICWSVDLIRNRMQHLGTVEATTEKQAVDAAVKEFAIERARRNRIVVTKISNCSDD